MLTHGFSPVNARLSITCNTAFYAIIQVTLWKQAYLNILKILQQKKKENFQIKNSDTFHISAQNIDCGYSLEPPQQGSSYKYPQSMFF